MAVGDVVSGLGGLNAILDFQPAAGVECCITSAFSYNDWVYLYDGTNTAFIQNCSTGTVPATASFKIFINNTRYLRLAAVPAQRNCYTGIQIK